MNIKALVGTAVIIAWLLALSFLLVGCTENVRTRFYGGYSVVELPCDQKFVNVTWKDTSMWYAYRPMQANEEPVKVTSRERSAFGVIEGHIVFIESRCH